ncbi:hypothetical protein PFISCL1PPCAC_3080, partial [Pristionchus fissidentatus]
YTPSATSGQTNPSPSIMKFLLLFSACFLATAVAVTVHVEAYGTIKCSVPFTYTIMLNEADNISDDIVYSIERVSEYGKNSDWYAISGKAFDTWPEQYVEPYLIVVSDCPDGEKHDNFYINCVPLGEISEDKKFHVDFDLAKDNGFKCGPRAVVRAYEKAGPLFFLDFP